MGHCQQNSTQLGLGTYYERMSAQYGVPGALFLHRTNTIVRPLRRIGCILSELYCVRGRQNNSHRILLSTGLRFTSVGSL
jgi:hypothetical protein